MFLVLCCSLLFSILSIFIDQVTSTSSTPFPTRAPTIYYTDPEVVVYPNGGMYGSVTGVQSFKSPRGVAVDSLNNLFVCDSYNNRIALVTGDGGVNINVKTYAGIMGNFAVNLTNGIALQTSIGVPYDVTVDQNDNVVIATQFIVRKIIRSTNYMYTAAGIDKLIKIV